MAKYRAHSGLHHLYNSFPPAASFVVWRCNYRTTLAGFAWERDVPRAAGLKTGEYWMKRILSVAATAALAVTFSASAAVAQLAPQLGLRAGVSLPLAALETSQEMGYNLGVSLGLKPVLSPVGVRFEAAFNQFRGKTSGVVDFADARIFEGTANLVLDLFPMPTLALYAIGGGGLYNTKVGSGDGVSDPGVNVGGGLRFGLAGFNAHVEARWHNTFSDNNNLRYIPVTVGISF